MELLGTFVGDSTARRGESAVRQLLTDAGFTCFRRAAETRFNIVYEARP
jgi:hypothetical protein